MITYHLNEDTEHYREEMNVRKGDDQGIFFKKQTGTKKWDTQTSSLL